MTELTAMKSSITPEGEKAETVRLGDAITVIRGASPRPKGDPKYFGGNIPWISIRDITSEPGKYLSRTREFVTEEGAAKSRYLPAGTLILSNSATVCIPKILSVAGCIHDGFVAFPDLPPSFDKHYLYWYFEFIRPAIIAANRQGITQVNLNTGIIRDIELPIAEIASQKKVVEEIELQLSRLDEAVANLKRVKANLKRYKAAVLKAAVEGRLVPTEAELTRKEGREYETGEQLLQRILETRRKEWKGKGKYKEPLQPQEGDLAELPDGWTKSNFDQLAERVTKGSSPNWQGFEYCDAGIVFVRSQNVGWGEMELDGVAFLPEGFNAVERKSVLRHGDVLLNIVGASIGRAAIAVEAVDGGNVNQAVAVIRLTPTGLMNRFALICLLSNDTQKRIHAGAVDVARANFSLDDVRRIPIALPPSTEQERIADEVERRLSLIRNAEAQTEANLRRAERLRQATLSVIFSNGGAHG